MTNAPARPQLRRALRAILVAALAVTLVTGLTASPARAAVSATEAEAMLLGWVNRDRVDRGLAPLVRWYDLAALAGLRAARMAEANTLSHTVAGNIGNQLQARGIPWYGYGETIGYTTSAWTVDAAKSLYAMWKRSAPHWTLLMSSHFNYVGVGMAYRSSNHKTFGSIVLTESPDHSGARARVTSASRYDNDVRWTWTGWDVRLQTHTSGFRDYDIQYRVDSGDWRMIRNDTTATAVTLTDRYRGHAYALRIRATDRRGNVGAWTSPSTVWVP